MREWKNIPLHVSIVETVPINSFIESCEIEIRKALEQMQKGASISILVFDRSLTHLRFKIPYFLLSIRINIRLEIFLRKQSTRYSTVSQLY